MASEAPTFYGLQVVTEIRCPRHGDVTRECVPEVWDGRATFRLMRGDARHPGCGERLLWGMPRREEADDA